LYVHFHTAKHIMFNGKKKRKFITLQYILP